jgi:hypothetical protein
LPKAGEAPAAPRGKAPAGEVPIAAAETRLVGAAAGVLLEMAINVAIAMALQWLVAKLQELELQADIAGAFKTQFPDRMQRLKPKLEALPAGHKVYVRVTYEYYYSYTPDPVWAMSNPPFYEPGSVRLVNLHPGNEELDFAPTHDEYETPIAPQRQRVRAVNSYSFLLDDPAKRARQREQAELAEKLKHGGASAPRPPAATPAPKPAADSPPPLLAPPSAAPPAPKFEPLPGAPDTSREERNTALVDWLRRWMTQLVQRGEAMLHASPSPSDKDIKDFAAAEQDWRNHATYAYNYFVDNGPEVPRKAVDEMLRADNQGGRLTAIRRQFGV